MSRTLYLTRLRQLIGRDGDEFATALRERRGWRPREVEMRLTWACEAHCEQCGMHDFARAAGPTYSHRLPVDRVLQILTELGGMGCESILFSGGEVTIISQLPQILSHATEHGISAHINTHGGNLTDEYCDRLLDAGLAGMMVSLDSGDPDQHDKIRKLPGLFEAATKGMRYLRSQRPDQSTFFMLVNSVIMKESYEAIPRLVDAVASTGVPELSLSPVSVDNEWDDWANFKTELKLSVDDERRLEQEIMPDALERAARGGVTVRFPGELMPDGTVQLYQSFVNPEPVNCAVAHYHSVINVNGDVIPCCYSSPFAYSLGNVRDTSFADVWNGAEYKRFREGCFPARFEMCATCSQHRNENELLQRWYERHESKLGLEVPAPSGEPFFSASPRVAPVPVAVAQRRQATVDS
jgi:radical SAM protein with 4Fe4S-binding SPASM domain